MFAARIGGGVVILSVDINSVRSGYAFGGPKDGTPRAGCWSLPGGGDLPRACANLYSSITSLSGLIHPDIIVIEAPLLMGGHLDGARPAVVLISLYGAACAAAGNVDARVIDAKIQTWRKFFIGHGNLPGAVAKERALDRCQQLRWPALNHDQAEACGIWAWAMATNFPKWAPRSTPLFAGAAA